MIIKLCGVEFESESKIFEFIEDKLYWLRTHNKNYTKDQYFVIDMVFEMIKEYNKLNKENEDES